MSLFITAQSVKLVKTTVIHIKSVQVRPATFVLSKIITSKMDKKHKDIFTRLQEGEQILKQRK